MKKRFFMIVSLMVAALIMLCGCTKSSYSAVGLVTTNDSEGWKCTFSSLDGEYTNTFPINSDTLRIESKAGSGTLNIVLKANGETETINGADYNGTINVDKFGEGNLYITLSAADAKDGSVRIVWEKRNRSL